MLGFTKLEVAKRKTRVNLITWALIIGTALILFAIVDSFYFHLFNTLQRHELQNCVMSYAYPSFTEIVDKPNSVFSSKYKLYLYREGHLDNSDELYGVPALFIPGQAGSHKQIRSLASATTHLYYEGKSAHNIDYFTVDLNEELSAMCGQTLLDQAEYMNQVIERILSLYKQQHKKPPTSVIIIGHSMGGLVARTMFMLPNYVPNSITNMITLATPHMAAPLLLDLTIYTTYKKLTKFWAENNFDNLTLISIAGGSLDNIIHSDGVDIASFIPATHGFTTFTTSISGVWTGADHMAILWCNQLIRILALTLLETVDATTVADRMRIYQHNLLDGRDDSTIQNQITRIDIGQSEHNTLANSNGPILFNAPQRTVTFIPSRSELQLLTDINKIYDHCWSLFVCKDEKDCEYTIPRVTVLPSAIADNLVDSTPFRLLEIDTVNGSFVGIAKHCQIPENAFVQLYQNTSIVHNTTVWSIMIHGFAFQVDSNSTIHVFPFIRNSLFAFDLKIISMEGQGLYKPMMKQTINNLEAKFYRHLEANQSDRITFHQEMNLDHHGLSLQFFTDRQLMVIEIRLDWYGTLGRCVLRYGAVLVNFLWVSSLIILMTQANTYAANGKHEFIAYPNALVQCLNGPFLQLIALLIVALAIIQFLPMTHVFALKHMLFGSNDWLIGGVLIMAFILGVGMNAIVWLLVSTLVFVCSLPFRFIRHKNASSPVSSTYLFAHLSIVAGLLGTLPSSVVFAFYFSAWVYITCCARNAARSDLPLFQNIYKYRQSWLIFLVSFLPYHVPKLIVFIKNLLIGWTYTRPESIITEGILMQLPPDFFKLLS
ncbi:hypothetical protein [Parasitella parasitica]|uniref:GPI inositol-deacylase n=1 Tax=Parasitella parasitica TaxID=35722 RepID=A0A0B7MXK7_9FUNG|nr:hypothetical protein [Parasitella parasitica]